MTRYTRTQIWLHWSVVVLVLLQWMSGDGIGRAQAVLERQEAPAAWDFLLTNLHLFGGGAVMLLTLWRLRLGRNVTGPASSVTSGSQCLPVLARLTHWALLFVLLLLPVSGLLAYYQWLPAAARWHELAGWALASLLVLHMLGLIWHSLRGEAVWRRMVTIGSGTPGATEPDFPGSSSSVRKDPD